MQCKKRVLASGFLFCALLAACGGGGGGGGASGGTVNPPTPQQTPTTGPLTTTASGTVVNDANGAALVGAKVVLEPWVAGATPLPAPQATTDASGNFTLANAPNGHYLLVIGNDTPGQTAAAVVHDNVTLAGGNQVLKAPTLPTIPGYTAPAWETNGTYRIATLDATNEVPCFNAWNNDRAAHSLPAAVPDEWLQENVRAQQGFFVAGSVGSRGTNGGYVTYYEAQAGAGGSPNCKVTMVDPTFTSSGGANQPAALSANMLWYGAIFQSVTLNGSTANNGYQELPYDPRFQADPFGNWP